MSRTGEKIKNFIKKTVFVDFIKGLHVTLGYNLSKSITIRYPDEEKWIPYRRFRGRHTLNRTPEGRELCVACELCAKSCPTNCITVIPMEDDTGRGIADRVAKVWKVDLVRCLFCGYCEDACPTRALRLGRDYELACTDLACTGMEMQELLMPQSIPETISGGVVAKARFIRDGEKLTVEADLGKTRKMRW
ncbi:MAG: NADH-quinone oxidoreductase subunit I [Thermodesulfobacteriota bacterium]|nr:MAG: NADH-quinone oxidoreductase subunit I [Thermodesulfobacteriota bacterium]